MDISGKLTHLVNVDPSGEESISIIRSILPHTQELEREEAQTFIDVLDQDVATIQADADLFRRGLRALRRIFGSLGLLPSSHLLSEGLIKKDAVPSAYGGYADIWEGTYGNSAVAIKSLRVPFRNGLTKVKKIFYKEVVIWKYLSHPNVVPFLGVSNAFRSFCLVSLWMPYGNATEYVTSHPQINRPQLLIDICKGLEFLYSPKIVHRDLKEANVLINSDRHCSKFTGLWISGHHT